MKKYRINIYDLGMNDCKEVNINSLYEYILKDFKNLKEVEIYVNNQYGNFWEKKIIHNDKGHNFNKEIDYIYNY